MKDRPEKRRWPPVLHMLAQLLFRPVTNFEENSFAETDYSIASQSNKLQFVERMLVSIRVKVNSRRTAFWFNDRCETVEASQQTEVCWTSIVRFRLLGVGCLFALGHDRAFPRIRRCVRQVEHRSGLASF